MLNRRFLEIREKGGTVALIFDEAQSIQPSMLEEIRLLTNLETSSAKLVQVILAGHPEFGDVIDSGELRALRQRLVFRIILTPLNAEDTGRYISARLVTAGAPGSLFTGAACDAVHNYSGGIPRLINVICDNAMLAGYALDNQVIENALIEEVAADLRLLRTAHPADRVLSTKPLIRRLPRRRLLLAVAIACLALVSITALAAVARQSSAQISLLTPLQELLSIPVSW